MTNTIALSKSLPLVQCEKFFDQFSGDNRGRNIAIEIIDSELGDQELIKNAPLLVMIYDRSDKMPTVTLLKFGSPMLLVEKHWSN